MPIAAARHLPLVALALVVVLARAEAASNKPTPKPTATPIATATATPTAAPTPTPTMATVRVTITDPKPGATIGGNRVNVKGTFVAPPNTGITVNDAVAYLGSGSFIANDVALEPGANSIQVLLTSPVGASANAGVSVTGAAGEPTLALKADVTRGLAPLTVTFSYALASTAAIDSIAFDFNGDGRDDFTSRKSPPATVQNTYTTPGLFVARLKVTDTSRRVYTAEVGIEVASFDTLDVLFLGVWNGMTSALAKRDVSTALIGLNARAAGFYAPIFQDLLADMPSIVQSFSLPHRAYVQDDLLEYAVNRTIDGQDRIFFVYLMRDADGVWRLESM